MSVLVASNRSVIAQAQKQTQTSTLILQKLEILAKKLGDFVKKTNKTIKVQKPNTAFTIKYIPPTLATIFP